MSDETTDEDDAPPPFDFEESDGRSTDRLLDALADQRARLAVVQLESQSVNVVELDDLADRVAEREVEAGEGDGSDDHRHQVAVALHHSSLPKLDDAAVLDYDPRSNTVRYWGDGRVSAVLELLDFASDD